MPAFSSILVLAMYCLPILARSYTLKDDYTGNNYEDFFNKFGFWTGDDPTNGYVDYVSAADAWSNGLLGNGGNIYLGVDHVNVAGGHGRKSVRLTSNAAYDAGSLFVVDVAHMPETCGTWPAFWTVAATSAWPQQGEIDIIEQANNANSNQMSLHVSQAQGQCRIDRRVSMTATKDRWGNCNQEANGGCDANDPRATSFGSGFNDIGGGVYAMKWTARHVRVWFFPRSSIPSEANGPLGPHPNPSVWGTPTTSFEGSGCDFGAHIKKQHIVFDNAFCGDWADGSWAQSGCQASTGYSSCIEYVKNKPKDFSTAFWTINSLQVFT